MFLRLVAIHPIPLDMSVNSDRVIEVARKYIGIREKPNNSGFLDSEFQKRMEHVGWVKSYAWCTYFVELVFREALPQYDVIFNKLFSGSATTTYKNFELDESGIFLTNRTIPKLGAAAIFRHGVGWQGHAGIVEDIVTASNYFLDIEGNTNSEGGREGIEVAAKQRDISAPLKENGLNLVGFIYLPDDNL